jgi:hypothetical protein
VLVIHDPSDRLLQYLTHHNIPTALATSTPAKYLSKKMQTHKVGPGRYSSPSHPTHAKPFFIGSNGSF